MKKKFISTVVPSMISFLFTGIYVSIDGLFVGQAVGDLGIAAINIAWPLAAVVLAVGTGIGMGGAINISNHMGAKQKEKANKALGNTLSLLFLASILLTLLILLFSRPILQFMGAEGEVLELGNDYVTVLGMGSILQVMGNGITPLLRNQNKSILAMLLMISNFVIDTILSGIFVMVLDFGVVGAAAASLIGQAFALISALLILFKKEHRIASHYYRLETKTVCSILKIGTSPFGLSFIPSFTIIIINWQALRYGGNSAVAAYAVVAYILSTGQLLLEGAGDGSQPLISFYHGANDQKSVKMIRKWTYYTALITGFLLMLVVILLRNKIPVLFGVSANTTALLKLALPICALSLPLYAFSRASSAYFYATKRSFSASVLIYSEPLLFLPLCALLFPLFFQLAGVWLALSAAQFLLLILSLFLLKTGHR